MKYRSIIAALAVPAVFMGVVSFAGPKSGVTIPNDNASIRAFEAVATKAGGGLRVEADLTGSEEVPPVDTDASGEFKMRFNSDFSAAHFELEVEADDVLQAHLHCGPDGQNGPVVVFLFGLFPGGVDVDGDLSELTITDDNIQAVNASCTASIGREIETIADLAEAIMDGLIYANVHTVSFTGGEIRGQVQVKTRGHDDGDDDGDDDDDDNENDNDNDNDNDNENDNENDDD